MISMKILSLLLVAMVTLTRAADPADAEAEEETDLVKRGFFCPSGWHRYGGRCFRYVPKLLTWADAEKKCQTMNAHLASVHGDDEYHWIQKMIADKTHAHREAWLGATDSAQENSWFWSDGAGFQFTHWCPNEPNNHNNQHCLQMNYSDKKCWDDLECHQRRASICAKRIWCF